MTDRLHLPRRYRDQIEPLLREHVPGVEVWAYGSRVNGMCHEASDLDLVLRRPGLKPLAGEYLDLVEAFQQSNIPILVQAHDWARLPENFHREIERDYVVVQEEAMKQSVAMEGEWREYEFAALCDITRGASPRPIHEWISEIGIPWLKIADASATTSRFINHTKERIRSDGIAKSVPVFPGDLILSNSATPGIPKFVGIEACIHDGWLLLRNLRRLDKLFCYYLLLFERPRIVEQGNGTVFTNLRTDILKRHRVKLPPLSEQRAIAHVLGTLDDKIELNRRMNATLEEMARALFKSWFVDFEPVRAKMEGRWRPSESLPGLPARPPPPLPRPPRGLGAGGRSRRGGRSGRWGIASNSRWDSRPRASTYNDEGEGLPFIPRPHGLWLSLPGKQEVLHRAVAHRAGEGHAGQR